MVKKRKATMPNRKSKKTGLNRKVTFSMSQIVLFIVVFAVVGSIALFKSFAAQPASKGGGKTGSGTSSLSLVMVTDVNSDGLPNHGDTITFNVSTTATTVPTVSVKCYQGSTLVYGASAGFYASYPWPWAKNMTLASGTWTSGGANCTAVLSGTKTLATLNFQVYP